MKPLMRDSYFLMTNIYFSIAKAKMLLKIHTAMTSDPRIAEIAAYTCS